MQFYEPTQKEMDYPFKPERKDNMKIVFLLIVADVIALILTIYFLNK